MICTDLLAVKKFYTSIESVFLPKRNESGSEIHIDGSMGEIKVSKRKLIFMFLSRSILLTSPVQDHPRGFPKLACFLDSDDAFMTYRRFGLVFSRLLLNKQDEIQELEGTLLAMDRSDTADGNGEYLMSRSQDVSRDRDSIPRSWPESRPQLLERLERKALEYGECITVKEYCFGAQ